MKISSGIFKGHSLEIPKRGIKPTSDKVRQALINHFRKELPYSRVADLYCGSGAVGIEFLSNGAAYCNFVEKASLNYHLLKKNLKSLNISDEKYKTLKHAVQTIDPAEFKRSYNSFDIIFADPFYKDSEHHFAAIHKLAKTCLNPGGTFVMEHYFKLDFSDQEGFQYAKKYGDTTLSYFQFSEEYLESSCN